MKTIAVYNMKGGVGKTTTAVNLSYYAALTGQRILLWDLDPQAASTFAFRVRPHVSGFDKASLESGRALSAAVKQTDYDNLYLLPADFAYRKLDRFLDSLGDPERLLGSLLGTVGDEFDFVILDCPAGFSRLIEALLSTADAILVPTIPTILSLRMVARLLKRTKRSPAISPLTAFFNMVDRRKTLHRRACELAAAHAEIFLSARVPYASCVEQMGTRRMPIAVYAPHEPATRTFTDIWAELQKRLHRRSDCESDDRWWAHVQSGIESMIQQLGMDERPDARPSIPSADPASVDDHESDIVHRFDTDHEDLKRRGQVLELRERNGAEFIVVARSLLSHVGSSTGRADARIDRSWAVQILAGEMSPLDALERRVARPQSSALDRIRAAAGDRRLRRLEDAPASHRSQAVRARWA